jgi:uncharacterized protein (TIGR02118 family)
MTIILTMCVRRRASLSPEEFDDYWQNVHGPLIRASAEALGYQGYRQIPTTLVGLARALGASRGAPEPYDGIAQIEFASVDAMLAQARSPEVQELNRRILEDEGRFIDLANSPIMLGDLRVIHPDPDAA